MDEEFLNIGTPFKIVHRPNAWKKKYTSAWKGQTQIFNKLYIITVHIWLPVENIYHQRTMPNTLEEIKNTLRTCTILKLIVIAIKLFEHNFTDYKGLWN